MADHFLQMHILKERCILFADVDPLIDHLIQHLGLLAGLMPHAHCIVHRDDRHNARHGKNSRINTYTAPGSNNHCTDCCAVRAGHAAIAPHALQLEFTQQDKIDNGFEYLSHKPAKQGNRQDLIERQDVLNKLHNLFPLFCMDRFSFCAQEAVVQAVPEMQPCCQSSGAALHRSHCSDPVQAA